jgi:flagellar basal-body rod protein FlgB
MDIDKIEMMNMLQNRMKYDANRQKALAENIANVDTPGYFRKDVTKPSFKGMVQSSMLGLNTTNSKHISGSDSSSQYAEYTTRDKVEIDMEALELSKNSADFAQSAATYKKMLSLIRAAISNK